MDFRGSTKIYLVQYVQQQHEAAQAVHTHRTVERDGLVLSLNPSPNSRIFPSVSVGSSLHSNLFTSATGRRGVHTAPEYGTKQYPVSLSDV